MKKVFIEPKMAIVEIESADIISTSGTGGSTNPSPWGARGRYDDDDFDF